MNTLHVDLGPQWRGGQHQALLLMRGLRSRGHSAELVALRGAPLAGRATDEAVTVHEVAPRLARPHAALLLRRLLAQKRYDVVHTHEAHALTAAWWAGAHRRASLVASRRVAYPLNSPGRYRAAQRVVAVSNFVAETVVASGLPRDNVRVIHDGVEQPPLPSPEEKHEARQGFNLEADSPLLGCVGYLLPEKGHEHLIRALPTIRSQFPNVHVLLAGSGPCEAGLKTLARSLGVEKTVIFGGFVEDVERVYRALDVFVFPSLAEPLGSSLLAAMAHGLPAVAVASGAIPEIVSDKRTGLLVAAPEADHFASAVVELLRDPVRAAALGAAARETVFERFTADCMVENTVRLYQELTA